MENTIFETDRKTLAEAFEKEDQRLYTLRSVLLGFPTTAQQKGDLKAVLSDENVRNAIKRKLYPQFSAELPLGGLRDMWGGAESQIMGKDLDSIKQVVEYKKTIIAFIEQALIVIDDLSQKPLDINAFKSIEEDPQQQWLVARNIYIGTVDQTCSFINAIASVPHREKEIAKRMSKNSAK